MLLDNVFSVRKLSLIQLVLCGGSIDHIAGVVHRRPDYRFAAPFDCNRSLDRVTFCQRGFTDQSPGSIRFIRLYDIGRRCRSHHEGWGSAATAGQRTTGIST